MAGLKMYHPEMGEAKPEAQIEVRNSWDGKHYILCTPLTLKIGRGIKHTRVLQASNLAINSPKVGWNEYYVTERAFEILEKQYTMSMELLLN